MPNLQLLNKVPNLSHSSFEWLDIRSASTSLHISGNIVGMLHPDNPGKPVHAPPLSSSIEAGSGSFLRLCSECAEASVCVYGHSLSRLVPRTQLRGR